MASDWTPVTSRAPSARPSAARYRSSSPGRPRQRRWPALQQIGAADDSYQRPDSQNGNAHDAPRSMNRTISRSDALSATETPLPRHSLPLVDDDGCASVLAGTTHGSRGCPLAARRPSSTSGLFRKGRGNRCDQIIAYTFALTHEPNRPGSRFRQPAHCATPGHV